MAINVKELRDLRGKAVADARVVLEKASTEKRAMNAEEKVQWDKFMADEASYRSQIEVEERTLAAEKEMAADALARNTEQRQETTPDAEFRKSAFRKLLTHGKDFMDANELRALSAGNDVSGGFLTTPQEFVPQLIAAVKDKVFMRGLATIISLPSALSCGVPTLDTDVSDSDWTSEVKTTTEDTSMAFGKRELKPHPLSKLVKVSNELLRTGALNPETIVMDRMSYKFAIPMEKGYLTGNGVQQPLGVFTASTDGIPTTRDVDTGNLATAMTPDGLIAAKYSLKAQHMANAKWLFHRDAVRDIASMKTGDGKYIFELSDTPNVPDMLLGRPMIMSEYVPNTFTSGSYVGMIGDFSYYWIADSMQLEFRRLNELFALTNQVGFIGRLQTDGAPVLAEAFSRVKLG